MLKNIRKHIRTYLFHKKLHIKKGLCFDGGANIGRRSKILLSFGCNVIAIEPQIDCILALNKLAEKHPNKITIINEALSNKIGKEIMYLSNINEVSSMSNEFISQYSFQKEINWNRTTEVNTTTLDHLIDKFGKPVYIKLDLEGYESMALNGLSFPINLISFEFNNRTLKIALSSIKILNSIANYQFNIIYYEDFKFKTKWLVADEMILHCKSIMENILTGEIYAKKIN